MFFQLPEDLKREIVAYDPVLKPLYKEAQRQSAKPSTPRMGLGVPTDLIPVNLFSADNQKKIVVEMNLAANADRCCSLENEKCCIFITHHASTWLAMWFLKPEYSKKNPGNDYVYGITIAYKNTQSTLNKVQDMFLGWKNNNEPINVQALAPAEEVAYNRVKMIKHTLLVTTELINTGAKYLPGRAWFNSYGKTTREKRQLHSSWQRKLKDSILCWQDEDNMFSRMAENGDVRLCVFESLKDTEQDLSFADILKKRTGRNKAERLQKVLETPYFKKQINAVFDETIKLYLDPSCRERRAVVRPRKVFDYRMDRVEELLMVYPDVTLDHLQSMYEIAQHLPGLAYLHRAGAVEWIRNNMPIASFLQIINKELEAAKAEWANDTSNRYRSTHYITGCFQIGLNELNDTFQMLNQLYLAQNKNKRAEDCTPLQLAKPDRWRLKEFHDYVAAEVFKIITPNERLHQDLFPEPVRVDLSGERWSFFQPQDVHQLASWGRTVRNCVGSADSYRQGIKKKTHFIVLAMINGQPRFTIQLKVSNGNMTVDQIADIANRRLNDQERDSYTKAFSEALLIRNSQLQST